MLAPGISKKKTLQVRKERSSEETVLGGPFAGEHFGKAGIEGEEFLGWTVTWLRGLPSRGDHDNNKAGMGDSDETKTLLTYSVRNT